MNKNDVELVISECFEKEEASLHIPTSAEWKKLEQLFGMTFPEAFVWFKDLSCLYEVDWQFLNVSEKTKNGNDTIESTYLHEMSQGDWDSLYIPFHSIGNGDYYCLKSDGGDKSAVYYYENEQLLYRKVEDHFEDWFSIMTEVFSD